MEIKAFTPVPGEAVRIRNDVFVEEQGFMDEFDRWDDIATHLVAFEGGEPIGTCRVFYNDGEGKYMVGRFAVLPAYRGKKIGAKLMEEAERCVQKAGGSQLFLHAQCRAAGFYEKQGYEKMGEVEDEEGVPHIWMYKNVM